LFLSFAFFVNVLHITIFGVTVDLWGIIIVECFSHNFDGWAVFLVCLALLMGENWVLLNIGRRRGRFRYDYIGPIRGPVFVGYDCKRTPAIAALVGMAMLAIVSFTSEIDPMPEIVPPHPSFASFPTQLGLWQGRPDRLTPDILDQRLTAAYQYLAR
jgi:hypothetical protein